MAKKRARGSALSGEKSERDIKKDEEKLHQHNELLGELEADYDDAKRHLKVQKLRFGIRKLQMQKDAMDKRLQA